MAKKGVKKSSKRYWSPSHKKSFIIGIIILLVATFLFSVFSFSTNSSGEVTRITGNALFDGSGTSIDRGDIAKFIMFFMVLMVVYWAISFLVEEWAWAKALFSAGVAYLATSFLIIDEIYSIMTTYSALGVTFTVIIPFVIVFLFTARLVTREPLKAQALAVNIIIWLAYFAFLVYYLASNRGVFGEASMVLNRIIFALAIVSLLIVIFNKKVVKWLRDLVDVTKRLNQQKRINDEKIDAANSIHRKEMEAVIRKEEEAIKKMEKMKGDYGKMHDEINKLRGKK